MPVCWLWYLLFVQCTRQDLGVTDFVSTLVRVWISNSSGVAATTRMHLSCSLVTASAVQRVLDNLFCTSTCCQGLVQESLVWKQNFFAIWTVVCLFATALYQKQAKCDHSSRCFETCFSLPQEPTPSPPGATLSTYSTQLIPDTSACLASSPFYLKSTDCS